MSHYARPTASSGIHASATDPNPDLDCSDDEQPVHYRSKRHGPGAYNDGPHADSHTSATRWRHQESSSYARHAVPRDLGAPRSTNDLADFLNSSRIEPPADANGNSGTAHQPIQLPPGIAAPLESQDPTQVLCGPMINYHGMADNGCWLGSVLVVTCGGGATVGNAPRLALTAVMPPRTAGPQMPEMLGTCLYSDPRCTFWQFSLEVPLLEVAARWRYEMPELHAKGSKKLPAREFYVPAATECMRSMFFSCNGFSIGTDEQAWSGIALWNDVMRRHKQEPFHVMIGGGDQIYNDSIRIQGPLREWTQISNPKKRRDHDFSDDFRRKCDNFYLENYISWYSRTEFAEANSQIPQLNIWDDHDIIDGYGSYVDEFMRCDMFRGIGGCAYKYYMLFQHHLPPPRYSYTTDKAGPEIQMANVYVAPLDNHVSSMYIRGPKPGPYIEQHAYHIYASLGPRMAIMGLDARTERTRHQINFPETYDLLFDQLRNKLATARNQGEPIKHLLFLLGIPIAYPRLTWLENIFRSPVMAPVKVLNRHFGVGGSLFNQFDGNIDLLDDLDDHYTAKTHKLERREMVERLQAIAAEFSVRVTFLGGDVHLAAMGRFYSNPSLKIPAERDFRFMQNIVSSAIVNKPPPQAVANLLAKRNKIHHLNKETDETLLNMFDRDPGSTACTSKNNHCTMPSRNFSILTENSPIRGIAQNGYGYHHPPASNAPATTQGSKFEGVSGHGPMCEDEFGAGTQHKAADSNAHGKGSDSSLDVVIYVEMEQSDREGRTCGYGVTIPALEYRGPVPNVWQTPFPSSELHHERFHRSKRGAHSHSDSSMTGISD
ncbi:hypothetical protein Cpir12675_005802 [Ceratocystis pirilliformis]|uniref:PhoD-like phosphatase domain-containing protein n=1 Tax=Ceratocystis pirilliformis TaxID=259994 RepID=A0ABR3YNG2_9PEZI